MSVSDPLADMLAKLHNASAAGHESVDIRPSRVKLEVIKILKSEGYVKNFKKTSDADHSMIRIFLKYDEREKPVIQGLKRLSKPGRRVYSSYQELPRIFNGFGTVIVSTSAGVTTGKKARDRKVGGELICSIW
jgi:small subunit ribosomal protein S8